MEFWKLHGTGNDFILSNIQKASSIDLSHIAVQVCHRRFGIGADGFMVPFPSINADIGMLYYNSDGSRAAMCGNGIRCFAKFVRDKGMLAKDSFTVETDDGIKYIQILDQNRITSQVRVHMDRASDIKQMEIELGEVKKLIFMHLGVPHSVILHPPCEYIDEAFPKNLINISETLGPIIEKNPAFPEGTNVNFILPENRDQLLVSTWERGAGRTWACGTGACASAAAAYHMGLTGNIVKVKMPGGEVKVIIDADGFIKLEGPAQLICKGTSVINISS